MSYCSFSNSSDNTSAFHSEHQFSTQKDNTSVSFKLLFEENENETESDFELIAVLLPFLINYSQATSIPSQYFSVSPFSEKLTNPIYLSVGNFRI
ncbi:MAG: hypothetical protein H0W73_15145 [Bacteroidetes bacterium]|nr:hypothetical protein [Bacteroidota bacterium]